jgi:hypothetical protein
MPDSIEEPEGHAPPDTGLPALGAVSDSGSGAGSGEDGADDADDPEDADDADDADEEEDDDADEGAGVSTGSGGWGFSTAR